MVDDEIWTPDSVCYLQKISIPVPTPRRVVGNSKGEGSQKPKCLKERKEGMGGKGVETRNVRFLACQIHLNHYDNLVNFFFTTGCRCHVSHC